VQLTTIDSKALAGNVCTQFLINFVACSPPHSKKKRQIEGWGTSTDTLQKIPLACVYHHLRCTEHLRNLFCQALLYRQGTCRGEFVKLVVTHFQPRLVGSNWGNGATSTILSCARKEKGHGPWHVPSWFQTCGSWRHESKTHSVRFVFNGVSSFKFTLYNFTCKINEMLDKDMNGKCY
jgi:hypothetical protein